MSKLEAALAWARRGFPVFPVEEGGKKPASIITSFVEQSTTDEKQIRAWWTDGLGIGELNYNIGFHTRDHTVLDVDVKNDNVGLATAKQLNLDWSTLVVKTPSGGYHLTYGKPDFLVGQHPIGPGVDVRSHHGYVLAPGSTINGYCYEIVLDEDPAPLPERLWPLFKEAQERDRSASSGDVLDSPESLPLATEFLKSCEVAIEGLHGDDATFRVLARLRDFGVSENTALELALEHWNPRCEPPWDFDDLEYKVHNAYRYATSPAGLADVAAAFAGVQAVAAPAHIDPPSAPAEIYSLGNLIPENEIEKRPWLFGRWLLRRAVTTLIAAPGGGKSMMTLIIACHGACGVPFAGQAWPDGPIKSLVYDAEDNLKELSRRVHAICRFYELDHEKCKQHIALVGSDMKQVVITKDRPPIVNVHEVNQIIKRVNDQGISFVGIGPLADIHTAEENDNAQMHYVMAVLAHITEETNAALMTSHHTAKPSMASTASWSGSLYAGRGASSVPAKARIVLTLFPGSTEDANQGSVPAAEKTQFVKLEGGKNSYAPIEGQRWFNWQNITLGNGEEVGVLVERETEELRDKVCGDIAAGFLGEMVNRGVGSLTAEEAIAVMRREGSAGDESSGVLRNRLLRVFGKGVRTPSGLVTAIRKGNSVSVVVR